MSKPLNCLLLNGSGEREIFPGATYSTVQVWLVDCWAHSSERTEPVPFSLWQASCSNVECEIKSSKVHSLPLGAEFKIKWLWPFYSQTSWLLFITLSPSTLPSKVHTGSECSWATLCPSLLRWWFWPAHQVAPAALHLTIRACGRLKGGPIPLPMNYASSIF